MFSPQFDSPSPTGAHESPGMNKHLQRLLVLICGAGTFYAAAEWTRQQGSTLGSNDVAVDARARLAPLAEAAAAPTTAPSESTGGLTMDRERAIPSSPGNAFTALSWVPPPPPPRPAPPAPPAPPPVPTAPALPFTFIGFVERGADRPQAYLAKGDALLIVGAGDVIDNKTYRVETLSAAGVVLTYLPLGTKQTVHVPGGTQ